MSVAAAKSQSTPRSKWRRFKQIISAVLVAILIGIGRGCIWRPADGFHGTHFNRGTNAAWLSVDWVNQPHSEIAVEALARDLSERQISNVFVFTTYLKADGNFNPSYNYASDFLAIVHATTPDLDVLAWIGLLLDDAAWGYVDLGRSSIREQITEKTLELVEMGFDGIHLDPEPIHNGNNNILKLLEDMRSTIPLEAILSIATPRIFVIAPEWSWPLDSLPIWRADYFQKVGHWVDQIVVMTYDSGMPTAWLYRHWVEFQVIEVSQALQDADVEILIGISVSSEETNTHHPRAENMESGLVGLINGLNDRGTVRAKVTGVAIYPYWETTNEMWDIYESLWIGSLPQ